MQKKMQRTVLSLLLAVLCFVGIGYPAVSARAEEEIVYEADYGNGWTISSDGVLMLENVEGWKDYLVRGHHRKINKLVLGKAITDFFLVDPVFDGGEEKFGIESCFIDYNLGGLPEFETFPFTLYLYPKIIEVDKGNPIFKVEDGLLINQKTNSLVLAQTDVKHVVIPDGITTVATGAFFKRSVETVTYPDTLVSIGTDAFYGCKSLKQATLPDSLTTIRPYAFAACEALEKISLPDSLQYIGAYAFKNCSALQKANLPHGVTHIGTQAFESCKSLQDVIIPDSLSEIGESVFLSCLLRLLVLPERLEITCTRDEAIFTSDLSDYLPNRVFGKSAVNTLVFTGSEYDFDALAFYRVDNAYFLDEPPRDIGKLLNEEYTTNIYCPKEYTSEWNSSSVDKWVRDKITFMPLIELQAAVDAETGGRTALSQDATPAENSEASSAQAETIVPVITDKGRGWNLTDDGVLTMENDAAWMDYLHNGPEKRVNKLVIGKNVTDFCMYDVSYKNLERKDETGINFISHEDRFTPIFRVVYQEPKFLPINIEVQEGNRSFVVSDGLLIDHVKKAVVLSDIRVKDVVIPEGIRSISAWAFYSRNVQSVSFPSTLKTIGAGAFSNCRLLTCVILPNSVTTLEPAAFEQSGIQELKLSGNIRVIEGAVFKGCDMREVTLPDSLETIGVSAFSSCRQLEHINLPEGLEEIDSYAFDNCNLLQDVTFPASLERIGLEAFSQCKRLKTVVLPDRLREIDDCAFLGCGIDFLYVPEHFKISMVPNAERPYEGWSEEENTSRIFGAYPVGMVVFAGSDYDFGEHAISEVDHAVFLGKPPGNIDGYFCEITSGSVYYPEEYESDWTTTERVISSNWSLYKVPLETLKRIAAGEVNLIGTLYPAPRPTPTLRPTPKPTVKPTVKPTTRPTATPKPTLMPSPTPMPGAENGAGADPVIIALGVAIALAAAAVVFLAVKGRKPRKKPRVK